MIIVVSGTNRPGSNTLKVCNIVQRLFSEQREPTKLIDLQKVEMEKMALAPYGKEQPPSVSEAVQDIKQADGVLVVSPEYNGSMPGILKYFIDHWTYPDCFEARPIACIGLGGRFGGVRPVEHLQQIFGYRNSYVFPERVFLTNVWQILKENQIADETVMSLLLSQVVNFRKFITALKSQGLDANSRLAAKPL
jgi:NAD(P)H-dependent FMN reductase